MHCYLEVLRTSQFRADFIDTLKENMLSEEAQFGVIVTTTLPKQVLNGLGQINGVWVCSQEFVESLAFIEMKEKPMAKEAKRLSSRRNSCL